MLAPPRRYFERQIHGVLGQKRGGGGLRRPPPLFWAPKQCICRRKDRLGGAQNWSQPLGQGIQIHTHMRRVFKRVLIGNLRVARFDCFGGAYNIGSGARKVAFSGPRFCTIDSRICARERAKSRVNCAKSRGPEKATFRRPTQCCWHPQNSRIAQPRNRRRP